MEPKIRRATADDWPLLREFLVKKLPTSVYVLGLVKMAEDFKISRKIYVTDPDPTLFIFVSEFASLIPSFCTFWDSERLTIDEAKKCLKSIPEWDWNTEKMMIARLVPSFTIPIENMILAKELNSRDLEKVDYPPFGTYGIKPQDIPKISLPEGFKIGILKPHHIPYIFSFWKYSHESVEYYSELLKILPSAAVYRKEDTEDDNPVSWCLLYNYGMLGMTYTLPPFRGKGLAKAVVANLSEKLVKLGFLLYLDIEFQNKSSIAMHEKLGFKFIQEVVWGEFKAREQ